MRAVCTGPAGEALTLGLAARALGPLGVDLAGFSLCGFGFLAGGVRCSWQQAVRVAYRGHQSRILKLYVTQHMVMEWNRIVEMRAAEISPP